MACRSSGTPTATSRRKGGAVVAIASSTSLTVVPLKAGCPASTLNIKLPSEKTSEAVVSGWLRTCSGDA